MAERRDLGQRDRYRRKRRACRKRRRGQQAAGAPPHRAGLCRRAMSTTSRFGPLLSGDGVIFRLWAPAAKNVSLILDEPRPMQNECGWFTAPVTQAGAGTRYQFKIDDDLVIPDPASRFQPGDVHGASEVIDHRYDWQCAGWKGRPWHETVFLELHVGVFTPQGTFRAAIERLDHIAATGITAIELMPLSDFP